MNDDVDLPCQFLQFERGSQQIRVQPLVLAELTQRPAVEAGSLLFEKP